MATAPNSNINMPQSPFLDPTTGRPAREWLQWLMNPTYLGVNVANIVPIIYGGTGNSSAPTNGQLLIGNAGAYALHALTAGSGVSVTNGAGTVTVGTSGATGTFKSGDATPKVVTVSHGVIVSIV